MNARLNNLVTTDLTRHQIASTFDKNFLICGTLIGALHFGQLKRYILVDGVNTLAHGHFRIAAEMFMDMYSVNVHTRT